MEGEHTPTIIQLIRSTDLGVIQFKDSHIYILHIPTFVRESRGSVHKVFFEECFHEGSWSLIIDHWQYNQCIWKFMQFWVYFAGVWNWQSSYGQHGFGGRIGSGWSLGAACQGNREPGHFRRELQPSLEAKASGPCCSRSRSRYPSPVIRHRAEAVHGQNCKPNERVHQCPANGQETREGAGPHGRGNCRRLQFLSHWLNLHAHCKTSGHGAPPRISMWLNCSGEGSIDQIPGRGEAMSGDKIAGGGGRMMDSTWFIGAMAIRHGVPNS